MSAHLKKIHAAMDNLLWGENQPHWAGPFAQVRHRIRVDASTDTASINANGEIRISPTLVDSLPAKQLGWVIAHEVSHPMLDHFQRMPEGADPALWNIAGDCVINSGIFRDGGPDALPNWVVTAPQEYTGPLLTEAIYAWLRRNPDKAPQQAKSASGKPMPGAGCGAEPAPASDGESVDWANVANQARAIDAVIGHGSAVGDILAPAPSFYDFASLLRFGARQADSTSGRVHRTFAKASRRDAGDLVMPGYEGGTPKCAIVIDCSDSMARGWVSKIASEVIKISKVFPRTKFYLITHTDQVTWRGWITARTALGSVPEATRFGGGTYVAPAYTELAKLGSWDAILHFTDCEVDRPWPTPPTRKFIVGAFGDGAFNPYSTPPQGAKVIPCRDLDLS